MLIMCVNVYDKIIINLLFKLGIVVVVCSFNASDVFSYVHT